MVDECAQRSGRMPPLRIVQVVTGERFAELLEHPDQLPPFDDVAHVTLERQRDAETRGSRALSRSYHAEVAHHSKVLVLENVAMIEIQSRVAGEMQV